MTDWKKCMPKMLVSVLERVESLTNKDLERVELQEPGERDVPIAVLPIHLQRFWAAMWFLDSEATLKMGKLMVDHAYQHSRLGRLVAREQEVVKRVDEVRQLFWKVVREEYDSDGTLGDIGVRAGFLLVESPSARNHLASLIGLPVGPLME